MERRSFLTGWSLVTPWLVLGRRSARLAARSLDAVTLRPIAEVVLPSELGTAGIERVITGFLTWIRGYRAGAERLHGYGSGAITRLEPSPAPRWLAQLRSLDLEAGRHGAVGFAALSPSSRRALIEAATQADRLDRVPPPAEARHVAIGLLAYFLQTPAAVDLCYRASIGKLTCRPLAANPVRPPPR
jgi:hypothetical protein